MNLDWFFFTTNPFYMLVHNKFDAHHELSWPLILDCSCKTSNTTISHPNQK